MEERDREGGGEREKILWRLCAVSAELTEGLATMNHDIMT